MTKKKVSKTKEKNFLENLKQSYRIILKYANFKEKNT